jgi:hypothetical protein
VGPEQNKITAHTLKYERGGRLLINGNHTFHFHSNAEIAQKLLAI